VGEIEDFLKRNEVKENKNLDAADADALSVELVA